MQDENVDAASDEAKSADGDFEASAAPGTKPTGKKSRPRGSPARTLSANERRLRHLSKMAKQFPNGPEAKELEGMEKPMPASLREKIRRSGKYELWSEAFGWLAFDLHRKARNSTKLYPKVVVKKLRTSYPDLDLCEDEVNWLEGWVGYLGQFRAALRSGGTYGPGVDFLEALGAERDVFNEIDSFDNEPDSGDDREPSPPEPLQPSIDDLPPTLREMPFTFTELSSLTAKTFWRAYWKSNDIEAICEAGRMLASDPGARDEMERLGEEAETFFVQTMAKLGIPLS
ncbi:MAG: hypothetical protein JJ901_08070 [Erythrobacter sp.]|uniref:hypothetical protein n=1 Tax=Erythrobacter sp. TaxID=1042 RepID=UPI001B2C058A|nr:hypothetical protein [Erythrobacter sp.]MBO6768245.1 hypothetical protein [Erythrobacter sp.]